MRRAIGTSCATAKLSSKMDKILDISQNINFKAALDFLSCIYMNIPSAFDALLYMGSNLYLFFHKRKTIRII